jgi:tRNA threonylcarbamoyl adenosine modification protein YeaZ
MWILAFEFSSDHRSVAVVQRGATPRVAGRAVEQITRSTPALALTEAALREAGVERDAIETLAIGLGPGSYTGIRMALALAQGWQLGREVRSVGLCSAEVMTRQAWSEGRRGELHVVIDAQRGDFYHAIYQLSDAGWNNTHPLRIEPTTTLSKGDGQWITPEAKPGLPWTETLFPDAATLGLMAAEAVEFNPAALLEPIYLRTASFVKAPPGRVIPGITSA